MSNYPFISLAGSPPLVMLETERMWLRAIQPDIWNYLFTQCSKDEIMAFLGLDSEEALEAERQKYVQGLTGWNRSFVYFQLILKSERRIIGWCGFHTWMLLHQRAEIGYALTDEGLRGSGYMREALKIILEYGFGPMELHRVEALIAPNNEPSLRLVKKLGFTQEGYLQEHYNKNGRIEDSVMFALLRREYKARQF